MAAFLDLLQQLLLSTCTLDIQVYHPPAYVSVPGMLIRMLIISFVALVHSPVQQHCMA